MNEWIDGWVDGREDAKTRQDKARQAKTRQDRTRQGDACRNVIYIYIDR
jgi:hypothetical protein